MNDAEADRTRQHLPEPTMPWQAPGAHIVDVGGSPGDRVGGAVSVRTLEANSFANSGGKIGGLKGAQSECACRVAKGGAQVVWIRGLGNTCWSQFDSNA